MLPRDEPGPVRAGEELDAARLEEFLRAALPGIEGPVRLRQFGSGYSNLTYLVTCRDPDGERQLVLRRPPVGSRVRHAHDMLREHQILAALHPVYPLAPRPLAACADPAVLGAPFYLMERVPGTILRGAAAPGAELPPATARRLAEVFIDNLADVHALDWRAAGLAELGRPEGYVERQVRGWVERYRAARTDEIPDLEATAARLLGAIPPASGAALVHNDYKYDNLVLDPEDPTRLRAVLDWEMATVGDPLLDLGTSIGYWVEAGDPAELRRYAFGPTAVPGSLTRAELVERYARRSGRDVAGLAYHHAFGLFKIAVIAQQIYVRFRQGLTRDPRFAALPAAVRALGRQALAVLGAP
jgi:aminoglycoside phosphotransferase (APT) family kinase protein